ncbi:beta-ketoacyl synthase N-terminal-like domain-containing protein, partial [Pseudoalteromonas holothuriae]|uniref:beta-ketoacyl synthase N-terminal-like domain-containing protein n=1 Tax=Pseudoalteromonas holothuriae TaxID=2963714 RepID=UPI0021BEBD04
MQQWEAVQHLDLPAYPFARTEHWVTAINTEIQDDQERPFAVPMDLTQSVKQEKILPMKDVIAHLITNLASVLFKDPEAIDIDKPLSEMGLDSILAVEWLQRVKEVLGVELLATTVYEYTTVALLAEHIAKLMNTVHQQGTTKQLNTVSQNDANIQLQPPVGKVKLSELNTLTSLPVSIAQTQCKPVSLTCHITKTTHTSTQAWLIQSLANVLQTSVEKIELKRSLMDQGLDSILGTEWVSAINDKYDIGLITTKLYEYSVVQELLDHLCTLICESLSKVYEHKEQDPDTTHTQTQYEKNADQNSPAVDEGIAIIGMAGQFPDAQNIQQYWENILSAKDSIIEIPMSRWSVEGFYDPDPDAQGYTSYNKWVGYLEGAEYFDPIFFNLSPAEANLMEPQQRLYLQTAWHCIEDAGIDPHTLDGANCGIFTGCSAGYYGTSELTAQRLLGGNNAILGGRVSYFLNLKGPNMAIDSACSSSLTALVEACNSLVLRNCDMAIAGGVCLLIEPAMHIMTSQAGMLSKQGKCFTFDERADGFVPGEGVGAILLKRYQDALLDEDPIYAIVRAWGSNHDGKTNGITSPNVRAQIALVEQVYQRFDIDPAQIGLVEAHGTGTALGDPIEIDALNHIFRHTHNHRCAVGSVKSNIGHLLTAAGVASIIKAALSVKQGLLPPSINFKQLNPVINLHGSPFYVNTQAQPWEQTAPRMAAVSAFGFSGSNAHVVLAQHIPSHIAEHSCEQAHKDTPQIIVLSAKNTTSLLSLVQRYKVFFSEQTLTSEVSLKDVAYTLQIGRSAFKYRAVVVASGFAQCVEALDSVEQHLRLSDEDKHHSVWHVAAAKHNEQAVTMFNDAHMVARSWAIGSSVDWHQYYINRGEQHCRIALPGYVFNKRSCTMPQASYFALAGRDELAQDTVKSKEFVMSQVRQDAVISTPASNGEARFSPRQIHQLLSETLQSLLLLSEDEIDESAPFIDLGVDSIIGVEWIKQINKQLESNFKVSVLYDHANLHALKRHISTSFQSLNTSAVQPDVAVKQKIKMSQPQDVRRGSSQTITPSARVKLSATVSQKKITQNVFAEEPQPLTINENASSISSHLSLQQLQETLTATLQALLLLDEIDPEVPFIDVGLDSILGVEWLKQLNKLLNIKLKVAVLYDYSTVSVLAGYLHQQKLTQFESVSITPASRQLPVEIPMIRDKLVDHSTTSSQHENNVSHVNTMQSIAIIGQSGRYPGAANLDEFWCNLCEGINSVVEIPSQRWSIAQYYSSQAQTGKSYSKWLGMLEGAERFDALFFNIAPVEAEIMDPQHRLFLEQAYCAFEEAGYGPQSLDGEQCGIYLGIMSCEYATLVARSGMPVATSHITGHSFAIAAARMAYHLNLKGPAIPTDTACSSSLVSIHLACQALKANEIDMALAGGVTLYLLPETYIGMSAAGMLAKDGQCKTFDNSADGFVPGEGVGCVVLKRLQDAQRDKDHIHAVIIASGINQDGKTNGITAPCMQSQIDLLQGLYDAYDIDVNTIGYAELHGTGTKLGDPIELEALAHAFDKRGTTVDTSCAIGSVKTNIGHASAAAGIASLHKVVQMFKHQHLVPSLNFVSANEHFDFTNSPFYVNTELAPWKSYKNQALRAVISSFGFSGTNAHLLVEQYKSAGAESDPAPYDNTPVILTISAHNNDSLKYNVQAIYQYLCDSAQVNMHDLAYTLQVGRGVYRHRLALVVSTQSHAQSVLRDYLDGQTNTDYVSGICESKTKHGDLAMVADHDDMLLLVSQWINSKQWLKVAGYWVQGADINWQNVFPFKRRRLSLPTYHFTPQSYWVAQPTEQTTDVTHRAQLHPLLHENTSNLHQGICYRSYFDNKILCVRDHTVDQKMTVPASVYVELAIAAYKNAKQLPVSNKANFLLDNLVWHQAAQFSDEQDNFELITRLEASRTGADIVKFQVDMVHNENTLAQGRIAEFTAEHAILDLSGIRSRCATLLDGSSVYARFTQRGLQYGHTHQLIETLHSAPKEALAKLHLPAECESSLATYHLHPSIVDAALQAISGIQLLDEQGQVGGPLVPFALE